MGKLLFVGVTCADVVINVDRLPRTAQDVVVYGQRMTLGGCAFNAFAVAHALGEPAVLFSPVGTGAFGDFVRKGLAAEGVPVLVENGSMENGCCYCFVEPDGERTFVAYHGADYHYEPAWFDALDMDEIDAVYVCGLEVEDPTGPVVVEFLERCCADKTICFTPGPRPAAVPLDLLERVCDLHPVLHMNGDEAMVLAGRLCGGAAPCAGDGESPARDCGREGADPAADSEVREMSGAVPGAACEGVGADASCAFGDVPSAVAALRGRVQNTVFATLGSEGCYFDDGSRRGVVPGVATRVVDTIGAGDSHIGALMVGLHRGEGPEEALARANRVAATVVATAGAHVDPELIRAAAQ